MFVNPQKIAQANQHPANRAALARLKEAGQSVMADEEVHLIALAKWGTTREARARRASARGRTRTFGTSWTGRTARIPTT